MKLPVLRILLTGLLCFLAWPALSAFSDNGDGTVTDTTTGLVWDKCSWGLTGSDCSGGNIFAGNWTAALGVVVSANTSSYKGYSDWRLPNINELESLVDMTVATNPTIDTTAFPNTATSFNFYWSSTTLHSNLNSAWTVRFSVGAMLGDGKNNADYVRLVRGGPGAAPFDMLAPVPNHNIAVAADPVAGGTANCDPNPVGDGTTSTCVAMASEGYQFTGWSGDCAGSGACSLANVTSDKSVTANFSLMTYNVATAVSPVAGGTVSCDPNPVNHGSESTCLAIPSTGYQFAQWSGDCGGSGVCTLAGVTSEKSVTALFVRTAPSGDTVTPVPTLSQWGIALLAALLGFLALCGTMRGKR